MENIFIAALAASFLTTVIDYYFYLPFWRAIIAAVLSAGALYLLNGFEPTQLIVSGLAAGFLTISMIAIISKATAITVGRR